MSKVIAWLTDPKARLWLYGITIAGIALLAFYGLISKESVPLWGALAVAILSVASPSVAIRNWNNVPSNAQIVDAPESSEG